MIRVAMVPRRVDHPVRIAREIAIRRMRRENADSGLKRGVRRPSTTSKPDYGVELRNKGPPSFADGTIPSSG